MPQYFPGRRPGLSTFRPFGATSQQSYPLEIPRNHETLPDPVPLKYRLIDNSSHGTDQTRETPFRDSITRHCNLLSTLQGAISDASQGSLPAAGQALPDGLVPAGFQLRLSFAHSLSLSFRCWLERPPVSSDFCWRQGNWIFRGIGSGRGCNRCLESRHDPVSSARRLGDR